MENRTAHLASSRWRLGVSVAAVVVSLAFAQGAAVAQTVRVFEYTPPIEQLRSILIPESTGGASRRIIISPSEPPGPSAVQPAATSPAPVPQPAPTDQAETSGASKMPNATPSPSEAPQANSVPAPAPDPSPHRHTPATAVARPAATAAPAPEQREEAKGVVGFRINFALNSAAIPADADPFLDELAELLRQEPQVALVVEGHTDAYGTDQYNLQLSALRAQAVTLALIHRGIAAERLSPVGKGKREPLSDNPYDPHNRRVQFVRVDGAAT
jgi:OmpA-OmpF porin, OOP family